MEMLGKVRRMYYRDGLSRSEISRRTGLSRNTVKKWLKARRGPRRLTGGNPRRASWGRTRPH
jgi:transposase